MVTDTTKPTPSEKLVNACMRAMLADEASEKAQEAARIAESAWKRKISAALLLARRESGTDMGRGNYLNRQASDLYNEARRIAGERIASTKPTEPEAPR